MAEPPKVGSKVGTRVADEELSDDFATLMLTGLTVSDAIRIAVGHLAEVYRDAWNFYGYPEGVPPVIVAHAIAPYDAASDTANTMSDTADTVSDSTPAVP